MRIKFTTSGESPDIGKFEEGEDRLVQEPLGRIFIDRKMAVEVKPNNPAPVKAPGKKEGLIDG